MRGVRALPAAGSADESGTGVGRGRRGLEDVFPQHYSVYPATRAVVEALGSTLAPGEYNGKGTIRFPYDRAVPVRLIGAIAKLRAAEESARRPRLAAKKR